MNKLIFQMFCFLVLGLSYVVVFTTGKSLAATEVTHAFPGTSIFTTAAGRLGFFEQGTGKIFIYDSSLSNCVYIGQMTTLGEPVQELKKVNSYQ